MHCNSEEREALTYYMMTKESPCHMRSKFNGSQLVVLAVGLYGSSIINGGRQISEIMDNICLNICYSLQQYYQIKTLTLLLLPCLIIRHFLLASHHHHHVLYQLIINICRMLAQGIISRMFWLITRMFFWVTRMFAN